MSKKIGILIGIAALIGLGVVLRIKSKSPESAKIEYLAVQVQKRSIAKTIVATGVVQPENRVEIKPPIAGRADQVLVVEGEMVKAGQILAWMSSNERAALLDAAQAKGPDEVKKWKELYKPIPVLAPISGMIISRKIEPGQSFTNADSVLAMSDRLTIKAQVDETDLALIQLRQPSFVTLDAYPNQQIPAWVEKIAYDAKTVNNVTTYTVTVILKKNPPFLRSGMTANVSFRIAEHPDALVIPAGAVKTQEGKTITWITTNPQVYPLKAMKDSTSREIKMGLSEGPWVEVTEGLKEGEWVLDLVYQAGSSEEKSASSPFSPMGGGRRPRGH